MRYFSILVFIVGFVFTSSAIAQASIPPKFPYGSPPKGNVCVSASQYATPESMLGSWAMIQAVTLDSQSGALPKIFQSNEEVVYAVGTAAIGNLLGVKNCAGGCNQLNGVCFALKFNSKATPKYMVFQSVNIGAATNSFDIYMAGGGSGAFPEYCAKFWGKNSANWSNNIENSTCQKYFHPKNIKPKYVVSYNGIVYKAADTLMKACAYATQTGFNRQNFKNVSAVPVTCPKALTQITGLRLQKEATVGNHTIKKLNQLTDADFNPKSGSSIINCRLQL